MTSPSPEPSTAELVAEAIARIIDPSSWRVFDGYLADVKRKYKGQNAAYDPEAFKDKVSMAKAREILSLTQPADGAPDGPRLSVAVKGVGRDSEMARTILVMCTGRPSDDDLRVLHDWLCGRPIHAPSTPPPRQWSDAEVRALMKEFWRAYNAQREPPGMKDSVDAMRSALTAMGQGSGDER